VLCNWILTEHKVDTYHKPDMAGWPGELEGDQEVLDFKAGAKRKQQEHTFFNRFKVRFTLLLEKMMVHKKRNAVLYLICMVLLAGLGFVFIGKDLMPRVNNGQFQMRLKAAPGTRLERTEEKVQQALAIIDSTVNGHVEVTSAFVGPVSSNYATSNLYVFNTGTDDAVIQVNLKEDYTINTDDLKEALRKNIYALMPDVQIDFEPIDLTEKVMSQGALNPIEVRVAGKDMKEIEGFADSLMGRMTHIPFLRDLQIQQSLHYPTVEIAFDRYKISQFGLTIDQVSKSLTAATSSSRFTAKNLWLDNKNSYTYQVQVEVPEYIMNEIGKLKEVAIIPGQNRPNLGDVAEFKITTTPGELDRSGPRRYLTIGADIVGKDLGTASAAVQKAVKSMGLPPKGVKVEVMGLSLLLTETLDSLQVGLMFAILVILLLLAANFESLPVALTVVSTVPAVILGSLLALFLTGSTLNLQSYMGMIMSTGVSVANALLIVTNAERLRLEIKDAQQAAIISASVRLRPIIMTSLAMVVGMIPMASGLGEAGEQTAPLGRAVIGGLVASTFAALLIVPQVYAWVRGKASFNSTSLLPE
jgi:multidrug efflux pump subunit AcrB